MTGLKFSPDSLPNLSGRVFLVTGGNAGIGMATVAGLASKGAKVYIGARNPDKARKAIDDIKQSLAKPEAEILPLLLDLQDFASVVNAANLLKSKETALHGLVNNAGIMGVPFALTKNGYEAQFQTNYLSHWLLTYHLLPLLVATAPCAGLGEVRIVNVTSDGHERFAPTAGICFSDPSLEAESSMTRYGHSKLANILHIAQLHALHGRENPCLVVAAVHPGHIDTNLNKQATAMAPSAFLRAMVPLMKCAGILDNQAKGALSSLYAIASPEFTESGAYVVPYAKIGTPSKAASDGELAGKLWDWTLRELQDWIAM
ncbi:hypothetical protein B0T25DRAFT_618133 [Lasiosphaeria hispida]|uniref:NAD(P)-binding protein n=1 Tax=Lasiosphaeria hispida TaxID=260671 RepID=A0AAJ0M7G2_9PEZI|nr:hypothetical protein B0T25DRAFT_618133 [Lasiosphaeria hispida]